MLFRFFACGRMMYRGQHNNAQVWPCTASFLRCSMKTFRLTSSVITTSPLLLPASATAAWASSSLPSVQAGVGDDGVNGGEEEASLRRVLVTLNEARQRPPLLQDHLHM